MQRHGRNAAAIELMSLGLTGESADSYGSCWSASRQTEQTEKRALGLVAARLSDPQILVNTESKGEGARRLSSTHPPLNRLQRIVNDRSDPALVEREDDGEADERAEGGEGVDL